MYTMAIILSSLIIIFILMFIIGCCCKDQDVMEGLQMTGFFGLIGCLSLSALPGVWFRYETKDIWHQVEKKYIGEHYACNMFSCVAVKDYYVYLEDYGEYEVSRETYYKVDTNWSFKITYKTDVIYIWEEDWSK